MNKDLLIIPIFFCISLLSVKSANAQLGLQVADNQTVLFGEDTLGYPRKLMWNPTRGAFRAGHSGETDWNFDSIGYGSVAFGVNTKARGYASTAFGYRSTAPGSYSLASGFNSTASGHISIAAGEYSVASGYASLAFRSFSEASGRYSIAFGSRSKAESYGSFVIALYNASVWDQLSRNNFHPHHAFKISIKTKISNQLPMNKI